MIALLTFACAVSRPFEGPGWTDGALTSDHEGPFLVGATYARPHADQSDAFDDHVAAIQDVLDSMDEDSGLIGYSLRGEIAGRDNWTLTVWTSEEAMYGFVTSEEHLAAMAEADTILEDASFTHWETDASSLPPDWNEALSRLDEADEST